MLVLLVLDEVGAVIPGWAWLVALLPSLFAYRLAFRRSYAREYLDSNEYRLSRKRRDKSDRFWTAALWSGPVAVVFWPLYLAAVVIAAMCMSLADLVEKDYDRAAGLLGGESREQKRERKVEELERSRNRTDDLERELKLGPYAEEEA